MIRRTSDKSPPLDVARNVWHSLLLLSVFSCYGSDFRLALMTVHCDHVDRFPPVLPAGEAAYSTLPASADPRSFEYGRNHKQDRRAGFFMDDSHGG